MNTMLRVLVIVITLLGATALVFAVLNFDKRQILLGRDKAFRDLTMSLSKTIEAQDAPEGTPRSAKLDIADVTDRISPTVDTQDVFDGYPAHFETQNLAKLNFSDKQEEQLATYYAIDEEGKVKVNANGQKITKGPGTQMELLEQILDRAMAQNATLDKTRAELGKKSDQVAKFVDDINKLKGDARVVKRDLTDAREEIVGLKDDKATLERNVAKLTADKKELESEIADNKITIETLEEDKAKLGEDLENAQASIENLKDIIAKKIPGNGGNIGSNVAISAGNKGKVVEANDEYKFAVIEFSPDAMMEMLGPERDKPLPLLDMNIRREGLNMAADDFVTKIKLRNYVSGKNVVVADILTDWEQTSVEVGDVVWF